MTALRTRDERPVEAALLAGAGGFLDAYTFLAHGGVFANAQTGNVVLFGADLANRQWADALRHVPPILAFIVGMVTVEVLGLAAVRRRLPRPARAILLTEAVAFVIVGLLPRSVPGVIVTVVITWAATLQIGTFRRVGDVPYTTTFTTGNLRSLVTAAFTWLRHRDRAGVARVRALLAVVICFAVGAITGGLAVRAWHSHAVIAIVPVLLIVLAALVTETRRLERAAAS